MVVNRAVLDLKQDILAECAVEGHQLIVGLFVTVIGHVRVIDEGAPDDDAPVRRDRFGQHIRAVGVAATIIVRAGLAFGVGLDNEAAEIGDRAVDLSRFGTPPCLDRRVERIRRIEFADLHRGTEAGGQIGGDAVGPQDPGQGGHLRQVLRRQN